MSDFGPTQLNYTTQELWDQKVEEARYAEGVIVNAVSNKSEVAKRKGDIIHVPIDQKLTVVSVGTDGTFTPQNYTISGSDITLNQWKAVPIQILDQAASQSIWTPASNFPTNAGKAFANQYDSDLASLHTGVAAANIVGSSTNPSAFGKGHAMEAAFKLADQNVPLTDLTFIVHPVSWFGGVMNEEQLTAADSGGSDRNALISGNKFPLAGFPVRLSTNIKEVGTPAVKKNLLLHKSALAIAWSKTNTFEKVRSTANLTLADLLVMQSVYGLAVIRSDHFCVINNSAAGAF
jgi:hypothetical protein